MLLVLYLSVEQVESGEGISIVDSPSVPSWTIFAKTLSILLGRSPVWTVQMKTFKTNIETL